jgi:hypothetical protein
MMPVRTSTFDMATVEIAVTDRHTRLFVVGGWSFRATGVAATGKYWSSGVCVEWSFPTCVKVLALYKILKNVLSSLWHWWKQLVQTFLQ